MGMTGTGTLSNLFCTAEDENVSRQKSSNLAWSMAIHLGVSCCGIACGLKYLADHLLAASENDAECLSQNFNDLNNNSTTNGREQYNRNTTTSIEALNNVHSHTNLITICQRPDVGAWKPVTVDVKQKMFEAIPSSKPSTDENVVRVPFRTRAHSAPATSSITTGYALRPPARDQSHLQLARLNGPVPFWSSIAVQAYAAGYLLRLFLFGREFLKVLRRLDQLDGKGKATLAQVFHEDPDEEDVLRITARDHGPLDAHLFPSGEYEVFSPGYYKIMEGKIFGILVDESLYCG